MMAVLRYRRRDTVIAKSELQDLQNDCTIMILKEKNPVFRNIMNRQELNQKLV